MVFTGRKAHDEVSGLVGAMDIAVLLNSNAYGSPMKVFEYLAMGKAVVAPSVEPVLEVLRENETGLLIAPGDASAMARKILELAGDPEKPAAPRAGRARIRREQSHLGSKRRHDHRNPCALDLRSSAAAQPVSGSTRPAKATCATGD